MALICGSAAFSCQKANPKENALDIYKSQENVIVASHEPENGATKTEIQNTNQIYWSPYDSIKVFGKGYSAGKFISGNTESAQAALFRSDDEVSLPLSFAIHPYQESCMDPYHIKFPSIQHAVAESYDPAAYPCSAKASAKKDDGYVHFRFMHLCGGIKFTVSQPDIQSVIFQGREGELLSGTLQIDWSGNPPMPFIRTVLNGIPTVTLTAPDEGGFVPGVSYFLTLPAVELKSGFNLSFRKAHAQATYIHPDPVTVEAGIFGVLTEKDMGLSFVQTEDAEDLSDAGTANCYVVDHAGTFKFRATVKGHGADPLDGIPANADVLWENFGTQSIPCVGDVANSTFLDNGYVVFSTCDPMQDGNALIAVRDKDGTILWSWHIWMCAGFDPVLTEQSYNGAGVMMDRNLGATSVEPGDIRALGLYYQWGRKDPFPNYTNYYYGKTAKVMSYTTVPVWPEPQWRRPEICTIAWTIANPMTYIYYSTLNLNQSGSDWLLGDDGVSYTGDKTRWNPDKGLYDPCPHGWRVPDGEDGGIWRKAIRPSVDLVNDVPSTCDGDMWDVEHNGINFGKGCTYSFSSVETCWYPATGHRTGSASNTNLAQHFPYSSDHSHGYYWSCSSCSAFYIQKRYKGTAGICKFGLGAANASGCSVRCQKIQ
ncbi:MAG: hypothetical protein J5871_03440 [Bacteroidales bacterium]|nr:hypothetical protein [Bacteroidales bacterium]